MSEAAERTASETRLHSRCENDSKRHIQRTVLDSQATRWMLLLRMKKSVTGHI